MKSKLFAGIAAIALTAGIAHAAPPFGNPADVSDAANVWAAMTKIGLAGPGAIQSFPYAGTAPHGMMLQTYYANATIDGHTGTLIVKNNYGPKDVTADQVTMAPAKHLGAITVMFRREKGYDADNQDWFWAKFLPDGSLDKAGNGLPLAGRVAKGADKGCIACHSGAGGDDYVFTTDAYHQ